MKPEGGDPKLPIQWEWIEEQWQLGRASTRQIAHQHRIKFGKQVNEASIRKRATQYGWQRDLSEAVRRETRRKLAAGALPEEIRKSTQETAGAHSDVVAAECATVEAASDEAVKVTVQHRSHAERMHAMATALECYVVYALPLNDDGTPRLEYEPGELKDIATAASCASNTRGRAIDIERKAYGLDDAARANNDSLSDIRAFLARE